MSEGQFPIDVYRVPEPEAWTLVEEMVLQAGLDQESLDHSIPLVGRGFASPDEARGVVVINTTLVPAALLSIVEVHERTEVGLHLALRAKTGRQSNDADYARFCRMATSAEYEAAACLGLLEEHHRFTMALPLEEDERRWREAAFRLLVSQPIG